MVVVYHMRWRSAAGNWLLCHWKREGGGLWGDPKARFGSGFGHREGTRYPNLKERVGIKKGGSRRDIQEAKGRWAMLKGQSCLLSTAGWRLCRKMLTPWITASVEGIPHSANESWGAEPRILVGAAPGEYGVKLRRRELCGGLTKAEMCETRSKVSHYGTHSIPG